MKCNLFIEKQVLKDDDDKILKKLQQIKEHVKSGRKKESSDLQAQILVLSCTEDQGTHQQQ